MLWTLILNLGYKLGCTWSVAVVCDELWLLNRLFLLLCFSFPFYLQWYFWYVSNNLKLYKTKSLQGLLHNQSALSISHIPWGMALPTCSTISAHVYFSLFGHCCLISIIKQVSRKLTDKLFSLYSIPLLYLP